MIYPISEVNVLRALVQTTEDKQLKEISKVAYEAMERCNELERMNAFYTKYIRIDEEKPEPLAAALLIPQLPDGTTSW